MNQGTLIRDFSKKHIAEKNKQINFIIGFIYFVFSLIFTLILWAYFFEIDVVLKAKGIVRPNKNISNIINVNGGKITAINYENGKIVKKGEILYEIDSFSYESEKEKTREEFEKTSRDLGGIQAILGTIKGNSNSFTSQNEYYNEYLNYTLTVKRLQMDVSQKEKTYSDSLSLGTSFVSKSKLKELKDTLEISKLDLEKYKVEFMTNKQGLERELKTKYDTLKQTLDTANKNIALSKVIAPIDGIIQVEKRVNLGDFINPNDILIKIVPKDFKTKVDIYLENKDINEIKEGQEVKYRIESLPYKEWGMAKGEVYGVSKDSSVENGGKYLVEASLSSNSLKNRDGKEKEIKIGTLTDVRIVTRKKKVLWYILEKLDFRQKD